MPTLGIIFRQLSEKYYKFEGNTEVDGASNIDIDRLAFLVCRVGWLQALNMRDDIALEQAVDYYQAVVHSDINRADNVQIL